MVTGHCFLGNDGRYVWTGASRFAFLGELQDGHRRNWFRDGAQADFGQGCDRNEVFKIGEAVSVGPVQSVFARDSNGHPRNCIARHRGGDRLFYLLCLVA